MLQAVLRKMILLTSISLLFFLVGCVSLATDRRKQGFETLQRGFTSLEETPDLHEIVTLKEVTIHVVGSRKLFDWRDASAYGSPVAAYANTKNEIWIIGTMVKGRIIINQAILGHELKHLMNFKNPIIADPDHLDELGA